MTEGFNLPGFNINTTENIQNTNVTSDSQFPPTTETVNEQTTNVQTQVNVTETPVNQPVQQEEVIPQTEVKSNPVEQPVQQPTQSVEQVSPIQAIQQQPNVVGENNLIASISPGNFDNLMKGLSLLAEGSDPIIVKNSTITRQLPNNAIVYTDISKMLNNNAVNMHIVNPKKSIKLLKTFKSNSNINILNDEENCRYIVTNGEIRLFLPKQDDIENQKSDEMPSFNNPNLLGEIELDKDTKNIITDLAKDCEFVEYLFQENKVKGLHIPETAIYIFQEYINDEKALKLDETNTQLSLQSTVFLPITAEKYKINLFQSSEDPDTYFSFAECESGLFKIFIYESLENTTGGDVF